MGFTENCLNILSMKAYQGIGNAWVHRNYRVGASIEDIVNALNQKLNEKTSRTEFEQLRQKYRSRLEKLLDNEHYDGAVALGDDDFPFVRGTVKPGDRPTILYYKGDLGLLDASQLNVTVIGLLNPTEQIKMRERAMVKDLLKNDVNIVSGLAFGCDGIAHEETLDQDGKTVGILPSPLNDIMPAKNAPLAQRILNKGGLLITEYITPFTTKRELTSRYIQRDRLQALFCDAIILAASYASDSAQRWQLFGQKFDCGARHAMRCAKEYGIARAVMYDGERDGEDPMFDLNRDVLMEDDSPQAIGGVDRIGVIEGILGSARKKRGGTMKQADLFN